MQKMKGRGMKWLESCKVNAVLHHACQQVLGTVLATVVPQSSIPKVKQPCPAQAGAAYALPTDNGSHVADGQPAHTGHF